MTASPRSIAPLYLAGFTTAFGAHGVATVLGSESDDIGLSLLGLGLVLALYDLAEVVLKPRRVQSVDATPGCCTECSCSPKTSAGVFQLRTFLGRLLRV
ncbi:hypothetical protein [Gordonia amicalis]|uniref:hypothetical protein n=1 Tax=Gordonia amicalis TaxID=89053 RepID=UPI001B34C04B|nr:hypothetical protein [Gordonia amicalis]